MKIKRMEYKMPRPRLRSHNYSPILLLTAARISERLIGCKMVREVLNMFQGIRRLEPRADVDSEIRSIPIW